MTSISTETNSAQESNPSNESTPQHLGSLMLFGEPSKANAFEQFETRVSEITSSRSLQTPIEVSDEFGLTEEQAETAINNAEAMRHTARVALRMPVYAFDEMLESDGVYKTVFETGYTRGHGGESKQGDGTFYRVRKNINDSLGISPKEGEPSIVHGYLDNLETLEYESDARSYGDITLVLKPEVIKRSTFTVGDSLKVYPPPPLGIEDACVAKEATRINWYTYTQPPNKLRAPYIETQTLGGVSFDDVEAVTITFSNGSEQTDRSGQIENLPALDKSSDKLIKTLDAVDKLKPDMPIQIQLPAFHQGTFPSGAVIELAQRYPNVTFIGVIDPSRGNVYETHDPYTASFRADQLREVEADDMAEDIVAMSHQSHEQAKQRKVELETRISEILDEKGLSGKIAHQIRFAIVGGN